MSIDNINSNDKLFSVVTGFTDWSMVKPYDFAQDFANWRKNRNSNKISQSVKPDLTYERDKYINLLKKEYPKGTNISQKFFDKTFEISNNLGTRNNMVIHCNIDDLLAIMYNESKFDSKLVSKNGKFAGLIQIDKTTFNTIFKNNKCNYEQFKRLSREKQLTFVQEYLKYRIETGGAQLDNYIDKNGKIEGGALFTLVWRPGDFQTKTLEEVAQKVRIKQNTIMKINAKLCKANKLTNDLNNKA